MPTFTPIKQRTLQDLTISVSTVNLGTYSTGGVTVTPTQLGLSKVVTAIPKVQSSSGATADACHFIYDESTQKILAYDTTATQVANATDLSNVTLRVTAYGA